MQKQYSGKFKAHIPTLTQKDLKQTNSLHQQELEKEGKY